MELTGTVRTLSKDGPATVRAKLEVEPPPHMGAEDFSYYQKVITGVFFFLGVRNEAKKFTAMLHTEYFDLDEDTLQLGVRAMSATVMDYLQRD